MSEKEKKTVRVLKRAMEALPDRKKEYLIGYAEGVAAMAERAAKKDSPHPNRPAG